MYYNNSNIKLNKHTLFPHQLELRQIDLGACDHTTRHDHCEHFLLLRNRKYAKPDVSANFRTNSRKDCSVSATGQTDSDTERCSLKLHFHRHRQGVSAPWNYGNRFLLYRRHREGLCNDTNCQYQSPASSHCGRGAGEGLVQVFGVPGHTHSDQG